MCLEGWILDEPSANCYLPVDSLSDFDSANNYCDKLGGSLAVIDSLLHNQRIADYVKDLSNAERGVWIGYTDRYNNEIWKTVNDLAPTFTNWKLNRPDNFINENCALMITQTGSLFGKWDDVNCRNKLCF